MKKPLSTCQVLLRALSLIVLPCAMVAAIVYGVRCYRNRPVLPSVKPGTEEALRVRSVRCKNLFIVDDEDNERMSLFCNDHYATVQITSADKFNRVMIVASKNGVSIGTNRGSQWTQMTPDGIETFNYATLPKKEELPDAHEREVDPDHAR